jgi:glutamate/aspartate transport system substrate-binding protein
MTKKLSLIASGIILSGLLLAGSASAAELTGTLKKISETGTITVGYREASVPFSYILDDGKPVGYAFEICQAIAENVKKELNKPDLKVNYQAITSANRIPLIQNGTVDVECGSTTNSKKRQREASFGINYFGIQVTAAVWKNSGIKSIDDLNGKNISVTAGTTAVGLLKNYAKEHNLTFNLLPTKNFAEGMSLVANKRAAAFVIDDVLLAGQIAMLPNPQDFMILDASLSTEPYAPMFAKDDAPFKAVVDKTIKDLMASGKLAAMYKKWFENPIPPKGANLNFPMNSVTKDLFAHPNSDGI